MTPRERIEAVLSRRETDRTPCDLWCTPEVMESLKVYFAVPSEDAVYQALGLDKIAWVEAPHRNRGRTKEDPNMEWDEWGVGRRTVDYGSGRYEEVAIHPLAGIEDAASLAVHAWPEPELYDFRSLASSCSRNAGWYRMLTFISIFEVYCWLKPMDESLMDLYINTDFAHRLIERITAVQRRYLADAFATPGADFDMVYLSDDFGMQDRPLIPIEKWREFFQEPYRELVDLIKAAGKRIFYHSDGAAFEVLREMATLGVDVVNPIQHSCPGMERDNLKRALGDRVVFHGAVDNQQVLPFGSPADVRREVRENIRVLGEHGGYIVAPCHMIQPGTPIENILALYDEVRR